ncbi:glycosyltransferase family 4 protein [Vagococcus fluvialis]|uniref:Glycosyltransferase family 4 protein n=1 Tax=Vagococcus fluvialis TaxID=2738 RepID=A0A7X6D6W8_9ENTE|nr:glycosyltransferase family 4 protein [Vagococcus fluvialis]MBO0487239.1 hypothetical protein [Vagococcus fluvialis]NKC66914.1 glycosyltransferase family 4 protein [Vagococcus fluvialis]
MRKIMLICPSNLSHMPYVKNYTNKLDEQNIEYEIINWDRMHIENLNDNVYRDDKIGLQRNIFDYFKFSSFILKKINLDNYFLIIFGLQLTFFMRKILKKKYKQNYILDIRDKNKIIHFFNLKKIVECSYETVISSRGYETWLPKKKYIINHNTELEYPVEIDEKLTINFNKICISSYGNIRDYDINIQLINNVKNSNEFHFLFYGEGTIKDKLENYCKKNEIKNGSFYGRYLKKEEKEIIENSSFVNVLRFNDSENNATALPNRLYNALQVGRPLLAYKGTYLSKIIEDYQIGIVIQDLDNMVPEIKSYVNKFDSFEFNKNRSLFLNAVARENVEFYNLLSKKIKIKGE